jgi:hypothetical protein
MCIPIKKEMSTGGRITETGSRKAPMGGIRAL